MVTFGVSPVLPVAMAAEAETVSSGFEPLDRLLPAGGVRRGGLLEWICPEGRGSGELFGWSASGAVSLVFAVARELAGQEGASSGTVVVVDRGARFHPPAIMPWFDGVGGSQLIVARPARDGDEIWAIDQALRCPGVAAVIAWPERVHPTAMRRWQLAARGSGAVGLLVRPAAARREPSWAEARVAVSPRLSSGCGTRLLRLSLVGGPWAGESMLSERAVDVELDLVRGRMKSEQAGGLRPLRQGVPACRAS
jgi:protein ImuA